MTGKRTHIPTQVQKVLRREAWYGCCRCGGPFFEYHHIGGYSQTGHVAEDMMLLCRDCHYLATTGALDEQEQRSLKKWPHNMMKGYSSGKLYTRRSTLVVQVGSSLLLGSGYKLTVDDRVLFAVRHGDNNELLVSLEAYDQDDNLSLLLVDNEWVVGADSITDFIAKPLWVRLSSPFLPRPLSIDARGSSLVLTGSLFFRGRGWGIGKEMLVTSGNWAFAGIGFFDCGFHFNSETLEFAIRDFDNPLSDEGAYLYSLGGSPAQKDYVRNALAAYRAWRSRKRAASK